MSTEKNFVECQVARSLTLIASQSKTTARVVFAGGRNEMIDRNIRPPANSVVAPVTFPVFLDEEDPSFLNENAFIAALTVEGCMAYHPDQQFVCFVISRKDVTEEQIDALRFLDRCVNALKPAAQVELLFELEQNSSRLNTVRSLLGIQKNTGLVQQADAMRIFNLKETTASKRIGDVAKLRNPQINDSEDQPSSVENTPLAAPNDPASSNNHSTAHEAEEGATTSTGMRQPDVSVQPEQRLHHVTTLSGEATAERSMPDKLLDDLNRAELSGQVLQKPEKATQHSLQSLRDKGEDMASIEVKVLTYIKQFPDSEIFKPFVSDIGDCDGE